MTILFAWTGAAKIHHIVDHLHKSGHQVITQGTLTDLSPTTAEVQPDVIIIDLSNGAATLDLISQLKHAYCKRVPVLVLCNAEQANLIEPALELGADDYLIQPDKEEKLKELALRVSLLARSKSKAAA